MLSRPCLTPGKKRAALPLAPAPCEEPPMQSGLGSALMSIAMIAVFLLAGGGVWLITKRRDGKKGALMLTAAAVMLGNVLIWAM
jgi:hypothetical protein